MHWMVEVDERDESSVRAALASAGIRIADEPPEPLEPGRMLIFCEAPRSKLSRLQRTPGVIEVMQDVMYARADEPLSGCEDAWEDPHGPLEGCDEPGDPDD